MHNRSTLAAFIAIVVLAGGNGVAVRFSNHELAPLWGASIRFGIATLILFAVVLLRRIPMPRDGALVGSLLYGLFAFALTFGLLYWGLVDAGAGLGQIILALVPLLTFLLAVIQGLERFRWQFLAGSVVSLIGIGIVFSDQVKAAVPLIAMLAIVGGAASMAESNVVIKRFPRAHPLATNAVAMAVGFVVLFAATLVTREPLSMPVRAQTWVAIGYVSVVGSVAVFSLFLYVIARWSASVSSYVMLLIPLVTVALGAALDHEKVTVAYFVGGPLVLAGVYLGAFAPPLDRTIRNLFARRPADAAWKVRAQAVGADAAACQTDDGLGNPGCT